MSLIPDRLATAAEVTMLLTLLLTLLMALPQETIGLVAILEAVVMVELSLELRSEEETGSDCVHEVVKLVVVELVDEELLCLKYKRMGFYSNEPNLPSTGLG